MTADEPCYIRYNWRSRWLSTIQVLADRDLQRATWLDTNNCNPHWCFVELLEGYFDDVELAANDGGYRTRVAEGLVSECEVEAVAPLNALLLQYRPPQGDNYNPRAILADPAWSKVVSCASETQEALADLLQCPSERHTLMARSKEACRANRRAH